MKTLIVGASGATGRHLVKQLLDRGKEIRVIVRSPETLPGSWKQNDQVYIIDASVLDIKETEMAGYLKDCDSVASCLGHNLTVKGLFGEPRKLVTDSVKLLCNAIKLNGPGESPTKFVLMNTAGNRNRDLNEPISFPQKIVLGLLRFLVPPHLDNETAADYLRKEIGQTNEFIEWAAVRPDSLKNETEVSEYEVFPSPVRSAIFNSGKTSRINVGHFMAELVTNDETWSKWKGQMPVIYNRSERKLPN